MGRISRAALTFSTFYKLSTLKPSTKTPPIFRNIHIKNIACEYASRSVKIIGLPEQPLENFTLENVSIAARWGLECINVKDIKLTGIKITPIKAPVMFVKNSQNVTVQKTTCRERVDVFLKIEGRRTKSIHLSGNNFSRAKRDIVLGKSVRPDSIRRNSRK
jgi:DNA sulfur modification protein DndE